MDGVWDNDMVTHSSSSCQPKTVQSNMQAIEPDNVRSYHNCYSLILFYFSFAYINKK